MSFFYILEQQLGVDSNLGFLKVSSDTFQFLGSNLI